MKSLNWGIKAAIVLIVAGIIFSIAGGIADKSTANKLSDIPAAETEEQLREAMAGEPHTVLVYNAPLTGEKCVDPLGILNTDFVALEYRLFEYSNASHNSGWKLKKTETRCGGNLAVYGDIPLEAESYEPYGEKVYLLSEIDLAFRSHVDRDFFNEYYPNGSRRTNGNEKYAIYGIKQGAQTAFLAEAGGGRLVLRPLKKGAIAPIDGKNDPDRLRQALDSDPMTLSMISVALILVGVFIIVISIIAGIIGRRKQFRE